MPRAHGDLVLLATIAQAYGQGDGAQNLYSLAHYSGQLGPAMEPGDIEQGLDLVGVESFRLVAPGQGLPRMVPFALSEGHMVLAQVCAPSLKAGARWVLLTSADDHEWAGIVAGWDFICHGISSRLEWQLTGHYAICANPLPDWDGSS